MSGAVTIKVFGSLPEALVCANFLEAHGIRATVDDFEQISVQWYLMSAFGGVRVSVSSTDVEAAAKLLASAYDRSAIEAPEYEQPRSYGRIAAWAYLLVIEGLIMLPIMILTAPFLVYAIAFNKTFRDNIRAFPETVIDMLGMFLLANLLLWTLIWIYRDSKEFHRRLNHDRTSR